MVRAVLYEGLTTEISTRPVFISSGRYHPQVGEDIQSPGSGSGDGSPVRAAACARIGLAGVAPLGGDGGTSGASAALALAAASVFGGSARARMAPAAAAARMPSANSLMDPNLGRGLISASRRTGVPTWEERALSGACVSRPLSRRSSSSAI